MRDYWPDLPAWKLWKAQLYQESRLDPAVCSAAGACGLAQFMPGTWNEVTRQLGYNGLTRFDANTAIKAGAYYQSKMRQQWRGRNRKTLDANDLGLASYNAGLGSILTAQRFCGDALLWVTIQTCLPKVTGERNAKETVGYVASIRRWWGMLEAIR